MDVYQLIFLEGIVATIVAIFIIYWFIRKMQTRKFRQNRELINKLNDNWVSDSEKEEIRTILKEKGIKA